MSIYFCTYCEVTLLSSGLVWRYNYHSDGKNNDKQQKELEKINSELLKKLNELESDLTFSLGNCDISKISFQANSRFTGCVTMVW